MLKYIAAALMFATHSAQAAIIPSGTTSVDVLIVQQTFINPSTITTPHAEPQIRSISSGGDLFKTVDLASNQAFFDLRFKVNYREERRGGSTRNATARFSGFLNQVTVNPTSTLSLKFEGTLTNPDNGETILIDGFNSQCQPICSLFGTGTNTDVLTFEKVQVRLQPVPLPATGILLAGGMFALSLGGRKRASAKKRFSSYS